MVRMHTNSTVYKISISISQGTFGGGVLLRCSFLTEQTYKTIIHHKNKKPIKKRKDNRIKKIYILYILKLFEIHLFQAKYSTVTFTYLKIPCNCTLYTILVY